MNYILAGYTQSNSTSDYDFWLIKIDENGNEQWNRKFGRTENEFAYSVRQTIDEEYIITKKRVTSVSEFDDGVGDIRLIKVGKEIRKSN